MTKAKEAASADSQKSKAEEGVKSALEVALERASRMESEELIIETEEGEVAITFEELKQKALAADNYREQMQYKQAEFENFRKRIAREQSQQRDESVRITELLDILDHFDRALESEGDEQALREGVELIRNQFWGLLERKGVEALPGVGEAFDPNWHEAIAQQPDDRVPADQVLTEFQRGYRQGERVLRAAKVVVSAGPETASPSEAETEQSE